MAFTALTDAEVDAKSPIDDRLMEKIQDDLDDLNSRVVTAGAKPFLLEVQGKLSFISTWKRSIAAGVVNDEFTPTQCRYLLKKSGTSGTLAFDIRKHTMPKTPITAVSHQYNAATQAIARASGSNSTTSIARATTQISTQSITHAKAANNIQSIVLLGRVDTLGTGASNVLYNLASAIDSDTVVGDYITFASCTNALNDGTYAIVEINRGGGNNVVVANASGVAQVGAAGTGQIKIMSYNFTNPINSLFVATYTGTFASHTNAVNDGTLTIYAINQSGNNIWVKNSLGVTQGGVAGSADTNLWKFNFGSAASATDYIAGETAHCATHTSGFNNGDFTIYSVNTGGNNVVLHNSTGVVQGGAAGTVTLNRWTYSLPSDPSAQVTAGDTMYLSGHTNALNDGTFTIKEVNRGGNNVVVYNLSGVAQGGVAGNVYTTKKLIQFASDQSANYTTDSYIEMTGLVDSTYNYALTVAPFRVLQVNRGGGSNYNVVIDNPSGASQSSPAGYVQVEMKSVFSSAPSRAVDVTALEPNHNLAGVSTSFVATAIAAATPLGLYLTSVPSGDPRDLSVLFL